MTIPRWDHWVSEICNKSLTAMVTEQDGDYVSYEDYKAEYDDHKQEVDDLLTERNDALYEFKTMLNAYVQAVREREELRKIANAAIAWVNSGESDDPSEPFVDCGTPDCKSCELVKVVHEYEMKEG